METQGQTPTGEEGTQVSWLQAPQQPHKPLESDMEQGTSRQWLSQGSPTSPGPGSSIRAQGSPVATPAKGRGCGEGAAPAAAGPRSWDPAR